MRLGTSSPLQHNSPEEWAENQIKLGCRCVNFPLNCNEPEEKIIAYRDAAIKNDLFVLMHFIVNPSTNATEKASIDKPMPSNTI